MSASLYSRVHVFKSAQQLPSGRICTESSAATETHVFHSFAVSCGCGGAGRRGIRDREVEPDPTFGKNTSRVSCQSDAQTGHSQPEVSLALHVDSWTKLWYSACCVPALFISCTQLLYLCQAHILSCKIMTQICFISMV